MRSARSLPVWPSWPRTCVQRMAPKGQRPAKRSISSQRSRLRTFPPAAVFQPLRFQEAIQEVMPATT